MEIVVARPEHIDAMCAITEQAKAGMAAQGIDQWQRGYPNRQVWEADVAEQAAYVGLKGDRVVCMFYYSEKPETSYDTIDGAWVSSGPYATIHRCAVDPAFRGQGIMGKIFDFACQKAAADGMASVRLDTHVDNAPMRRAAEKAGFVFCGEIILTWGIEAGDPRLAFEKLLS